MIRQDLSKEKTILGGGFCDIFCSQTVCLEELSLILRLEVTVLSDS